MVEAPVSQFMLVKSLLLASCCVVLCTGEETSWTSSSHEASEILVIAVACTAAIVMPVVAVIACMACYSNENSSSRPNRDAGDIPGGHTGNKITCHHISKSSIVTNCTGNSMGNKNINNFHNETTSTGNINDTIDETNNTGARNFSGTKPKKRNDTNSSSKGSSPTDSKKPTGDESNKKAGKNNTPGGPNRANVGSQTDLSRGNTAFGNEGGDENVNRFSSGIMNDLNKPNITAVPVPDEPSIDDPISSCSNNNYEDDLQGFPELTSPDQPSSSTEPKQIVPARRVDLDATYPKRVE